MFTFSVQEIHLAPSIVERDIGAYLIFVISFTQAAFSNSKFYTPNYSKMSLKSKIYAVFVFNLENVTPDRIFLHGQHFRIPNFTPEN